MRKVILILMATCGLRLFGAAQEQPALKSFHTDQIIAPYDVEVTFNKTVHILFPSAVRYVDLGSTDIIAGKAGGAENVVRIKAAVEGFDGQTNFSVITSDGCFYTFNVTYSDNPKRLSFQMDDWLRKNPLSEATNDRLFVRLKELGGETPVMVNRIMDAIYREDVAEIHTVGCKRFGIQTLLKSIHIHNDLMYFHLSFQNTTAVSYDMDYIRFKVVDKKVARRTAVQETYISPVRVFSQQNTIAPKGALRNVFVFEKMTLPNDKVLMVEISERNGGRHLSFEIDNDALAAARTTEELNIR